MQPRPWYHDAGLKEADNAVLLLPAGNQLVVVDGHALWFLVFQRGLGTTIGMLLANVPVVYAGDYLMKRIPLNATRIVAALAFAAVGLFHMFG